jgi:hypothetical protein
MKIPMLTVMDDYEPIPAAKPTKAGFYLLIQEGEDPQIVEVVIEGDQCMVYMPGSAEWVDLDADSTLDRSECQWAGPLEPPR